MSVAPMPEMIEIANAEKTFTMHLQGGVRLPVVRGVNFVVSAGECVVLAGPSGVGKSSILKMIFGSYRCDRGSIFVHDGGQVVDIAAAVASRDGDEGRPGDRDGSDRPGARRSARALHATPRLLDIATMSMSP